MDFEHTEPEVDTDGADRRHIEHITHFNDAVRYTDMTEDGHCPEGSTRIGCCKCILDPHPNPSHLAGGVPHDEEEEDMPVMDANANVNSDPYAHRSHPTVEDHEHSAKRVGSADEKPDSQKKAAEETPAKKTMKLAMSTSEEQTKSKTVKPAATKAKTEAKKAEETPEQPKSDDRCPRGFQFEKHAESAKKACRMPMSYDLGQGHDYPCEDCHYSYGRWLDPCDEHFVRNGCCTCTPICPEGMAMDYWEQTEVEKNNYVCLIRSVAL